MVFHKMVDLTVMDYYYKNIYSYIEENKYYIIISILSTRGKKMSLLDNVKENTTKKDTDLQDYKNKINDLENQLENANQVNNNNIKEINELKEMIKLYSSQISEIKSTYSQANDYLKNQLMFEKEINERYLSKIVETNNNLEKELKNINRKSEDNNKELLDLFNKNNEELSNSTSKIIEEFNNKEITAPKVDLTNDIENIKSLINDSNEEVLNRITENSPETAPVDSIKDFISSNHDEIINKFNDNKPENIDIDSIIELINSNKEELLNIISQNKEEENNHSNKILEEINKQNETFSQISLADEKFDSLEDFIKNNNQQLVELITQNKEQHVANTSKVIDEINNQSINSDNDVSIPLNSIEESINSNMEEILGYFKENLDFNKIKIFNKISDDLKNENYVNLKAYKKIKDMNLFDEIFYKDTYDYDLDIDPLLHYIYLGYEENKKPNDAFDNLQYKSSHEIIKESNLNPLVYFVSNGIKEGNIKINEDVPDIKHINKFDIDKEIENFTVRGVKKSKRKPRLMVSISTSSENINDVQYTIYSLLNQEVKPDKVILCLNKNEFPDEELDLPKNILRFKRNGLSIRFFEDEISFASIIPIITEYPNDIVVTANDNIFYPRNWLKTLYEENKRNENTIIGYNALTINVDAEGNVSDYSTWTTNDDSTPTFNNFLSCEDGILYPPNSLHEDVKNRKLFDKLCKSEDIWYWAMSVLNNQKSKMIDNPGDRSLTFVNPLRESDLLSCDNEEVNINEAITNLINTYPDLLSNLETNE